MVKETTSPSTVSMTMDARRRR